MRAAQVILVLFLGATSYAQPGPRAQYIGGTLNNLGKSGGRIDLSDPDFFTYQSHGKAVRVPYERINLLEYGQKVDRRYAAAILVSPLLLLSRSRKHFLTIGYTDEAERQQALLFKIDKKAIRAALVSLEAKTGLKVRYQDDEARKAGKG